MPTAPTVAPASAKNTTCGMSGSLVDLINNRGMVPPTTLPYAGQSFTSVGDVSQCTP